MFWAAGRYTVFDDEAFSALRYTLPPVEMVKALWHGDEPDPPLYYLIQSGWVRVFGIGPLGLRSLSIVLFLAGLVFVRRAGELWFNERTGRLAMLLCAIHPAHLFFGFAGRWYAAMFCAVAILLWQTGRLIASARTDVCHVGGTQSAPSSAGDESAALGRRSIQAPDSTHGPSAFFLWSLAAAVVCYVNYFGPVVVGFVWVAAILAARRRRGWLHAAVGAIVLYLPWFPPFWRQVTSFPQLGGSALDYAATLARSLAALLAGNLASARAWWVWAPLAVFGPALLALFAARRRRVLGLAAVACGCLLAGTLSRTMIDKYVMSFSAAAWLAVAAGLAPAEPPVKGLERYLRRVALIALCLAWLGCGVNLVTQRHWSSLRWLDPFPQAIADLAVGDLARVPPENTILPHPSARYYYARRRLASSETPDDLSRWRALAATDGPAPAARPATVSTLLDRMAADPPQRLILMETAGFSDDPDARALEARLSADYKVIEERTYLDDPDAELKNRLDPRYTHPAQRIRIRLWQGGN